MKSWMVQMLSRMVRKQKTMASIKVNKKEFLHSHPVNSSIKSTIMRIKVRTKEVIRAHRCQCFEEPREALFSANEFVLSWTDASSD